MVYSNFEACSLPKPPTPSASVPTCCAVACQSRFLGSSNHLLSAVHGKDLRAMTEHPAELSSRARGEIGIGHDTP